MFKEFIDACLVELSNGNRLGTSFNKLGWKNIVKTMKENTSINFDEKQIKNKWDSIKKEWKLYERLMRHETGIGGTRSSIDASKEWWEENIKVEHNALFDALCSFVPGFGCCRRSSYDSVTISKR